MLYLLLVSIIIKNTNIISVSACSYVRLSIQASVSLDVSPSVRLSVCRLSYCQTVRLVIGSTVFCYLIFNTLMTDNSIIIILYVCLPLCQSIHLFVCLSISHLNDCPSDCLAVCPRVRLSLIPSVCQSVVCQSVRLPVCRSVRLSICPSVRLSFCSSVVHSVRPPVRPTSSPSICLSVILVLGFTVFQKFAI